MEPEPPLAVPLASVPLEPVDVELRTRTQRALDSCDATWCDLSVCELPCALAELVSIVDCDLGCV